MRSGHLGKLMTAQNGASNPKASESNNGLKITGNYIIITSVLCLCCVRFEQGWSTLLADMCAQITHAIVFSF